MGYISETIKYVSCDSEHALQITEKQCSSLHIYNTKSRPNGNKTKYPGGSVQLPLYGGVRPHYWKIDPSAY